MCDLMTVAIHWSLVDLSGNTDGLSVAGSHELFLTKVIRLTKQLEQLNDSKGIPHSANMTHLSANPRNDTATVLSEEREKFQNALFHL